MAFDTPQPLLRQPGHIGAACSWVRDKHSQRQFPLLEQDIESWGWMQLSPLLCLYIHKYVLLSPPCTSAASQP